MTFFELCFVELNPRIRFAFGKVWNIEVSLENIVSTHHVCIYDHLKPYFWNIENIVSTHHVCMAGTQGNVGARPMGSGVQWARGGVLMRVEANIKYTKRNIHISW